MEKKINRLYLLSSEEILNEINSTFINELSKQKKISKEMNKQLIEILEKIKIKNDEKGNTILCDILSNQKISKMLKAFSSKELTELFNFVKKYKKKTEKNQQKNIINKKEEDVKIDKEPKIEEKKSISYKNIDISLKNLLNQNIPFELIDINKIPDKFEDINSFIDYYFKKEFFDNYKSIIDIYNNMNSDEKNNSNYVFYEDILITSLEVRCYGIFLTVEFEKVEDIQNKFKNDNLLIISSLDSEYIFITEIYLNPYNTRYFHQLEYITPPLKENYQKIKVKLLNVDVLKKLCLISSDIKFQMFEYENQLSLSKVSLKALQDLDVKKFSIPESFERIFFFEQENLNLNIVLEQVKECHFNPRKIYNLNLNRQKIINFEGKVLFPFFIGELLDILDTPLLIVSRDNRSVDNILLNIFRNDKTNNLKIKKITGNFNNNLLRNRQLYTNYHLLGYENKGLDEKIKYEWHNLKRSLSENRVNSKTIKYCQTFYNLIIDDFYELSGLTKSDKYSIKSHIMECFLNEKNLKGFIQSQTRSNPDEILSKFSIFLNCVDKDYKIKYLWERNDEKAYISTDDWKDNNISYWLEQDEDYLEQNEEEEEYNDDCLIETQDSEEINNKQDIKYKVSENKIIDSENIKINKNPLKNKNNKNISRKNCWLLDENERREFLKKIKEQIYDYDFNHHNNLVNCIEQFEKQEIEYSYKFLKEQNILGMTIYNGIKLKEVIDKMRIDTIIINNPEEVSRSELISLFHPLIKNIFYLFSNY